jgi:hypothetical protein
MAAMPRHPGLARTAASLVAALVVVPTTAGCEQDFATRSGTAIAGAAFTDMGRLRSVTVSASLVTASPEGAATGSDGEASQADLSVDLSVTAAGRCVGTLSVGDERARLVGADHAFYLLGDTAFWDQLLGPGNGQPVEQFLQGRWAEIPSVDAGSSAAADTALDGLGEICALDGLLGVVRDEIGKAPSKGATGDLHGARTLTLSSGDGTSSVTVSAEAPHYIRQWRSTADGVSRTWSFTGFDRAVGVVVPDSGDVVSLADLRVSGG